MIDLLSSITLLSLGRQYNPHLVYFSKPQLSTFLEIPAEIKFPDMYLKRKASLGEKESCTAHIRATSPSSVTSVAPWPRKKKWLEFYLYPSPVNSLWKCFKLKIARGRLQGKRTLLRKQSWEERISISFHFSLVYKTHFTQGFRGSVRRDWQDSEE